MLIVPQNKIKFLKNIWMLSSIAAYICFCVVHFFKINYKDYTVFLKQEEMFSIFIWLALNKSSIITYVIFI